MAKKYVAYSLLFLFMLSCQKEGLTTTSVPEFEADIIYNEPASTETGNTDIEEGSLVNWISLRQGTSGLLVSAENIDFVSLYDNALAAILFSEQKEFEKAELILDFFTTKIESELEAETGGFFQFRNSLGENGTRKWLGDNAWLLIAIHQYHKNTNTKKYESLAVKLESWIRSLQDEDGGLFGGHNEDGTVIPKITEGMLTAYNAVPGYDDFHKNILRFLQVNRWNTKMRNLNAWPENQQYVYALDVLALSQGVLEDFPEESLNSANALFLTMQTATLSGEQVTGYCFDEDKDVVWLEGTAQMAVAMNTIGNSERAQEIQFQIEKTFIQGYSSENSKGIPYVTNFGSNYGATILWDHADTAPALSPTVWYLFAKMDFNPLLLGRNKQIPETHKFWKL